MFQPIVPFSGPAGWAFLQRTQAAQQASFAASGPIERDTAYFADMISSVETPEDLISDYRLLKVALGAFGLDDDLPNKAFIRKVLEEGSLDPESFANRMADKRYLTFTKAFGFDLTPPNTARPSFIDEITDAYRTRQFEIAVGETDNDMRLALALDRDLTAVAEAENTENGRWFALLGSTSLRQVAQTALGLPSEIAAIDLDDQVTAFRAKAQQLFGNGEVAQFADPAKREELTRLFLVRSQIAEGAAGLSSGAIALALLQGG